MERLIATTNAARLAYHDFVYKHGQCTKCPLHADKENYVFARGILPCHVLFIGEAPGVVEDTLGYPFVGPAGRLLDQLLAEVKTRTSKLSSYAITNSICCAPYDSRGGIRIPLKEEALACTPRLVDFITDVARPKLIVCLGTVSHAYLPIVSHPTLQLRHPAYFLRRNFAITDAEPQKFILSLVKFLEQQR